MAVTADSGSHPTIFSIFRRVTPEGSEVTKRDYLRPGHEQVAAGYIIYGSSTMFVYSVGEGVHGFTLDPSCGEYVLSHEDIQTIANENSPHGSATQLCDRLMDLALERGGRDNVTVAAIKIQVT